MRKPMQAVLTALLVVLATFFSAQADDQIVGVRLEHLSQYSKALPGAADLVQQTQQLDERFFRTHRKLEKVHIVTLTDSPYTNSSAEKVYPLMAFVEYDDKVFYFEQFDLIKSSYGQRYQFRPVESISLGQTRFKAKVGLVKRVLYLEDTRSDIQLIFPLGVGSFDEAVFNREASLLTPRFKEGYLSKRVAIEKRSKPRYFSDKPFIRVLWGSEKKYTGIGFHAQPNLDTFIRAFDSHGCIRMPLDDLELFFHLVDSNPLTYIPITITYHLDIDVDHPFPKTQNSYKRVQNVGSEYRPKYTIDRDYLVQTEYKKGTPPVDLLYDFVEDDYENYFNYSSQPCKTKSFGDEPRDGWDEALTSKLAFQRCKPRKKRNLLYRWWVH